MKTTTLFAAVVAATTLFSATAMAEGALISSDALLDADRAALAKWIESARQADPEPFRVVANLEREMPALDAQKRGRFVPVTRSFRAMGHRALPAIVERLVFNGGGIDRWTASAETAYLTGLVQVLGEFVDARVEPVLHALVEADSVQEFHLVYTTVGALGWHGTETAERHLLEVAARQDDRQFAVLAGLGQLHTVSAVEMVTAALTVNRPAYEQKWLVKSIRDAGNRGYWRWARKQNRGGDEWAVRLASMQALVKAFVSTSDDVQLAAANGIMMVDHPETPAALNAAKKGASTDLQRAIDKLQDRFANPPLMRRRR